MKLFSELISFPSLIAGFHKVLENDAAPGWDKVTVDDFENDLQKQIGRLYMELKSGKYRPQPLLTFERSSPSGKKRLLNIVSVRDRVIQSAATAVLEPLIEGELSEVNFAYRKGFSRESAARVINKHFREGYVWILDADIRGFFDSVNHSLLLKRFLELTGDAKFTRLVEMWIKAECIFNGKRTRMEKGIPQGAVISPMLANLYLDKFDDEISKRGLRLVRFADDFVIATKTKPQALDALKISAELLGDLKLEMNIEKTGIKQFSEGFIYLGYIFLNSSIVPASHRDTSLLALNDDDPDLQKFMRSYKKSLKAKEPELQPENQTEQGDLGRLLKDAILKKGITPEQFLLSLRKSEPAADQEPINPANGEKLHQTPTLPEETPDAAEQPDSAVKEIPDAGRTIAFKRTLYIQKQGAEITKEQSRFVVLYKGEELLDVPAVKINDIITFGTCSITPAVLQYCLLHDINIYLLSSKGNFYGTIESMRNREIELEKMQHAAELDSSFALSVAKKLVGAKLNNQKVFLQNAGRKTHLTSFAAVAEKIKHSITLLDSAVDIAALRGIEGNAAAAYFSVYGQAFKKETGFYKSVFERNRRPPRDPVNSLLSFGYTLLSHNIYSALKAYRLNPYFGLYHVSGRGHAALASDIMEEFRFLIDNLVVHIINRKILTRKHFYLLKEPDTPCLLTNEGRREFIRQFEIKMHQIATHTGSGKRVDYRRCLYLQAKNFAAYLSGLTEDYIPFTKTY